MWKFKSRDIEKEKLEKYEKGLKFSEKKMEIKERFDKPKKEEKQRSKNREKFKKTVFGFLSR
jgi:hypothetical protein